MNMLVSGVKRQLADQLQGAVRGGGGCAALERRAPDLTELAQPLPARRGVRPDVIVNPADGRALGPVEAEPERACRVRAAASAVMVDEATRLTAPILHSSTGDSHNASEQGAYVDRDATGALGVHGASECGRERARLACAAPHGIFHIGSVTGARGDHLALAKQRWRQGRDPSRAGGRSTWRAGLAPRRSRRDRGCAGGGAAGGRFGPMAVEPWWRVPSRLARRNRLPGSGHSKCCPFGAEQHVAITPIGGQPVRRTGWARSVKA
jgi:dTDP-4-dehydrorhamnose reductase